MPVQLKFLLATLLSSNEITNFELSAILFIRSKTVCWKAKRILYGLSYRSLQHSTIDQYVCEKLTNSRIICSMPNWNIRGNMFFVNMRVFWFCNGSTLKNCVNSFQEITRSWKIRKFHFFYIDDPHIIKQSN